MNKPLILVVEDDRSVNNLITTILKTHDYRYLTALNGAEAVLEASSHNPDIVLLDLGLPDTDGVDIIKKIRTWSNMPIIVISARNEDKDKIEALDAGADDYVTKPFSVEELLARLRATTRRLSASGQTQAEDAVFENGELRIEYPTLARRAVALQLDREMKAEEMRLLYVAMTRAREKLILVHTSTDWAKQCAKLAPDAGAKPDPEALNTLSTVGEWLLLPVLARPDAADLRAAGGVTCQLLIPEDRWDIRLIPAVKPGVRRTEQTEQTARGRHLTEEEFARLNWINPYAALADAPSKVTATQLKGRELDEEAAEGAALTAAPKEIDFARPRFDQAQRGLTTNEIGTAMHTVMQLIRLDHTGSVSEVAEEVARLEAQESLTPESARAVRPDQVAAFFASALGREALCAPDLRREFKFSLLTSAAQLDASLPEEEQVLMQGVIDCCFTGPEGLTVVDFKTDRLRPGEEQGHSERYRAQIEAYSAALSRITGVQVRRRVLWYFSTGIGVEI